MVEVGFWCDGKYFSLKATGHGVRMKISLLGKINK